MALVTVPELTPVDPGPGVEVPESRNPTTRFFQDAVGGEWMGKDLGEAELLGEAMGSWVGGRVGLNVPDGGVRERTWYSAWQKLPQWTATGAARVAPEEVARMIVFDVVLGIPDRHPGNVLIRSVGGVAHLVLIDHELATTARGRRDDPPVNSHPLPGLPWDDLTFEAALRSQAKVYRARAGYFSDLSGIRPIWDVYTDDAVTALRYRCDHAEEAVDRWITQNQGARP